MKRLSRITDHLLRQIGNVFAWSMPLLVAAIVIQVILRYGFSISLIKLEELQWHLYAMAMMIGLSYAFISDSHIRIDVLHQRFSPRTKAIIDILGTLLLLFPFLVFLFWNSLPFVQKAFEIQERSNDPSGLGGRWLIKSFIPLGCLLLFLAGCSRLIRNVSHLRNK